DAMDVDHNSFKHVGTDVQTMRLTPALRAKPLRGGTVDSCDDDVFCFSPSLLQNETSHGSTKDTNGLTTRIRQICHRRREHADLLLIARRSRSRRQLR